jgi:cysteinyl-tRNA synthetase
MGIFRYTHSLLLGRAPLKFHNTLSKKTEDFLLPSPAKTVRMYNCGPTVYGVQHIGNLSMFVFTDLLRRTLEYNDFAVKQVINITDVGHLSSDADSGEDKMTLGLQREGMALTLENMRILAEKYAAIFFSDLQTLNIDTTRIEFPRASDYIPAQIAMIQTLQEKGYAYVGVDGVYFDTSRFPAYGTLGGINLEGLKEGARVATVSDKRQAADFALWKFDTAIGWESPWGRGFPGWHIECSAMIRAVLGQQIDIHTGGIEHIPVHHNNEIAQSECATGKRPLSRFWLHRAHIQIEGGKIAKSQGNVVYLSEIIERGFHPLSLRYLFLGAHYRTNANFSWEALQAAQVAFSKLVSLRVSLGETVGKVPSEWSLEFLSHINNDLDTPGALAVVWEMTKDKTLSAPDLLAGLLHFDRVLGLNLANPDQKARALQPSEVSHIDIPQDVQELLRRRQQARAAKDWILADQLRAEITAHGFSLEDTDGTQRVLRR